MLDVAVCAYAIHVSCVMSTIHVCRCWRGSSAGIHRHASLSPSPCKCTHWCAHTHTLTHTFAHFGAHKHSVKTHTHTQTAAQAHTHTQPYSEAQTQTQTERHEDLQCNHSRDAQMHPEARAHTDTHKHLPPSFPPTYTHRNPCSLSYIQTHNHVPVLADCEAV